MIRRTRAAGRADDRRGGWTLPELAAVLGVLTLLAALIAPAVHAARESARRTQCVNNLKNLALGVHSFAAAHNGTLPLLDNGRPNGSWIGQILPHIDQQTLDARLVENPTDPARDERMPLLDCPSAPGDGGSTDYVANAGYISEGLWDRTDDVAHRADHPDYENFRGDQDEQVFQATGVFSRDAGRGPAMSLDRVGQGDGTSQTALISENVQAGDWWSNATGDIGFGMNVDIEDLGSGDAAAEALATDNPEPFNASSRPNAGRSSARQGTAPRPSSYHGGGVNMAYADGRVAWLGESVDAGLFAGLLSSEGSRFGQHDEPIDWQDDAADLAAAGLPALPGAGLPAGSGDGEYADLLASLDEGDVGRSSSDSAPVRPSPPLSTFSAPQTSGGKGTAQVASSSSSRRGTGGVSGTMFGNRSTGNGGYGINFTANTSGLTISNNTISSNGSGGIAFGGSGNVAIQGNQIANNGATGTPGAAGGIDIDADGDQTFLIEDNFIEGNTGDGIEISNTGGDSQSVTATGNWVVDNTGRGVDVLVSGDSDTSLTLGDGTADGANRISSNDGEGVYVVNTASTSETQASAATDPLQRDGAVDSSPSVTLDIDQNLISSNGVGSGFSGGGLVIRSGTTAPGGGITARVTDNTFGGNYGDDVYMESFTSTVDPPTTQGTWDANNFNLTTFEPDPVARLDLEFHGNTGNSLDVTNVGAFYDNPDTFKSRLDTATPAGPFTSTSRRRNAQRLPGDGPPDAGPGANFQYPGLGESTFRIEAGWETSGFQTGQGFLIDNSPVPPTGNANGVFLPNPIPGELPYGWQEVPDGTFNF